MRVEQFNAKTLANFVQQHCVGLRVRQLNRVITGIFNSELTTVGVTSSQFNLLTAIIKMQPVAPVKLAKVLHLEKSTLSRNLKLMRRNGWLRVEGSSRNLQISLTVKGNHVYARTFPCWEKAQYASRKVLGEEMADNLRTVIKSLEAN